MSRKTESNGRPNCLDGYDRVEYPEWNRVEYRRAVPKPPKRRRIRMAGRKEMVMVVVVLR